MKKMAQQKVPINPVYGFLRKAESDPEDLLVTVCAL